MIPRPKQPIGHRLGNLKHAVFDSHCNINDTKGTENGLRFQKERVVTFGYDVDDLNKAVEGLKGDFAHIRDQVAEMMKDPSAI